MVGVVQAVVVVGGGVAAARLDAFVVVEGGLGVDVAGVRGVLAGRLPAHMVPATVTVLELPLTSSGKVDVRGLPAPAWSRCRGRGCVGCHGAGVG